MREILFRGKAVNGITIGGVANAWVYGDVIHYAKDEVYIMDKNSKCWDVTHDATRVIPETIGQFTGIVDNEGKKIFEGDVVTTDLQRPYNIVGFDKGSFIFHCFDEHFYDEIILYPPREEKPVYEHGYVVGNIHNNPELRR